jgi:hypothetical protein
MMRSERLKPFQSAWSGRHAVGTKASEELIPSMFRAGQCRGASGSDSPFSILVPSLASDITYTRNVEAAGSSETPVPIVQITRHNIQEERNTL